MSKIEWTNETWNPIIGCNKISEGCQNCYAEKMAYRLRCMALAKDSCSKLDFYVYVVDDSEKWNGKTLFIENALNIPAKWKNTRMIFVCSMSDLFHEKNSFDDILQIWDIMCQTPRHTFQVLTKRPGRMLEFYRWLGQKVKDDGFDSIPSSSSNPLDYIGTPYHIWIGVTTENQKTANERIPILLQIPAKIHFISAEPLLENINLLEACQIKFLNWLNNNETQYGLQWVIAGPETGSKSRSMKKEWIESLYNQCKEANVPFFDKKDILRLNIQEFPK